MTRHQGNAALDLGAHLWALAWPLLAGLALGFFAVHYLQHRRLRWSWALLGAPLAYLLWFAEWHLGLALATATALALWLGLHHHQDDLQRGGEEARASRDAVGPLRWISGKLSARRAAGSRITDGRLALGPTERHGVCRVPIGGATGIHALVIGATGSGKTVSKSSIAEAHILIGHAAINIDPKGDSHLRATLYDAAQQTGARFTAWSPDGDTIYNPLARGNPTEIADKALAAHQWSEPHYELATRRLLGHALATMKAAGKWPPTLSTLVAHMDPERLDALACQVGGESAERVCAYVDGLGPKGRADLAGGRDRLAVLAESELGPRLDPALGGGEQIDLARSLADGDVLYFHLDSDRYPAAAKLVAAALITDLISLIAERQGAGCGGLLLIDEFAALAAEQVSRLFARARSAGLSILLGTQSLADLRGARPDDPSDTLTEQLLSNVSYLIAHRVADPDSAERLARVAGTVPAWTTTQRVGRNGVLLPGGEGTRTRQRDFLIGPDRFKRLRTGEAVVIDPTAKRSAEIVRIWPPRGGGGGR